MSAECYWCSTNDEELRPPLGVCSDCWVLTCAVHAERDTNIGKWKCFDGVAKLLSVAAGLDEADDVTDRPISTAAELTARFPRIASASEAERTYWSPRTQEIGAAVDRAVPDRHERILQSDANLVLLGHAVGIVRHFVPKRDELERDVGGPRVTGRLGLVLEEI